MSYKGICSIHGPHYEDSCPLCGPSCPVPLDPTPEHRAALKRLEDAARAVREAGGGSFEQRRSDQLSRELGIEDVADAFAGVEREQLETELYKVGCALIAAIEEYGVEGELGISADGFKAAGGKTIGFAVVGDRVYVTVGS